MWHSDGLVELLRNAYLRERDPDDLRHVSPFYALAETCSHSAERRLSPAEPSRA
jgi:hypothetical protein